jgi:UDP-glucose 4-epimerase
MRVLVTGGAGYIDSHTLVELLTDGHEAFVIDNLSNGHEEALSRVKQLAKKTILSGWMMFMGALNIL